MLKIDFLRYRISILYKRDKFTHSVFKGFKSATMNIFRNFLFCF